MVILIDPGAYRNANVGISNDKGGKIPLAVRLRFPGDVNQPGVSRVLSLSRMAKAMASRLIFRDLLIQRCGDGAVTLSRPYGYGR